MIIDLNLTNTIKSLVGEFEILNDYRKDSIRTGVFEIKASNKIMFVKIHNRLSRWSQEVYAYTNWMPSIATFAPNLVHSFHNDTVSGIIITPIQGRTINEWQITDENILEKAYFQAGELLRILHDTFNGSYFGTPSIHGNPFEKDVTDNPVNYINLSLENILKEGFDKGLLSKNDKDLVEWCIENSSVFNNNKPVPTNWDFSQNNWMTDMKGSFTGIIDFENMLWGIDIDSFGIVIERYTQDRPRLKHALFEGYRLEKDMSREFQLRIISVKMAIADITHGSNINDKRIFTLARNLLDSLQ